MVLWCWSVDWCEGSWCIFTCFHAGGDVRSETEAEVIVLVLFVGTQKQFSFWVPTMFIRSGQQWDDDRRTTNVSVLQETSPAYVCVRTIEKQRCSHRCFQHPRFHCSWQLRRMELDLIVFPLHSAIVASALHYYEYVLISRFFPFVSKSHLAWDEVENKDFGPHQNLLLATSCIMQLHTWLMAVWPCVFVFAKL